MKLEEAIKQKRFESPQIKAMLNIMYTSNWLMGEFRDIYKPYGITPQQYNVLRILRGKHPESVNPSEIKEVMLDKNPDITRLCDRLLAMGLIGRSIDAENRRKMNIVITDQGLHMLAQIQPLLGERQALILSRAGLDYGLLSDLLDELRG
ncbi:MAG: MarR family transcriptional regulator [Bacteroidetes bacterium]|nr:MarR family transcriptional regulator [Bacteroidota bacterium]